jgi:SAM-dependent methyltransferase
MDGEVLYCPPCDRQFPIIDGIPSLVRQEDAATLADSARQYRAARLQEGWSPLSLDQALALPQGSPPGYHPLYWEVRRQSYNAMMEVLACDTSSPHRGPVADLGAGTGWLAHRLAAVGYRVLAVETSLEEDFGLKEARTYLSPPHPPFLPVQGDLEHPPVQRECLKFAIFNASLHYAHDLGETLRRIAGILREDGCLIILDTPLSQEPHPSASRCCLNGPRRSLGRRELEDALTAARLIPRWITIHRGLRWWIYQAKRWLRQESYFSFPMVIAHRGP